MKIKKLSLVLSCMLSFNAFAGINFYQEEGDWVLAGFENSSDYYDNEIKKIDAAFDSQISNSSSDGAAEMLKENKRQMIFLAEKDKMFIDRTLSNLKKGNSKESSKSEAITYTNNRLGVLEVDNSDYNSNNGDVDNSVFKKANNLDCSFEEVSNYTSKKHNTMTKAFNTIPNQQEFTVQNKKAKKKNREEMIKTGAISGETAKKEDECDILLSNLDNDEPPKIPDLPSASEMMDGLSSLLGSGVKGLGDLGASASDSLNGVADAMYESLKGGVCSRLKPSSLTKTANEIINDEYKAANKGSALEGTSLNKLDTESGQNSFTYKIIKNQSELSNSNLIKAMDVTRDDQQKHIEKAGENELDDVLDDLQDSIFG